MKVKRSMAEEIMTRRTRAGTAFILRSQLLPSGSERNTARFPEGRRLPDLPVASNRICDGARQWTTIFLTELNEFKNFDKYYLYRVERRKCHTYLAFALIVALLQAQR